MPIPAAARSTVWVYDRPLAGIAGSNIRRVRWIFFYECCVMCGYKCLRRADSLSRAVLPSVCVIKCDQV